jgi:hypothetical protein
MNRWRRLDGAWGQLAGIHTAAARASFTRTFEVILPMHTKENCIARRRDGSTKHIEVVHSFQLPELTLLPLTPCRQALELPACEKTKGLLLWSDGRGCDCMDSTSNSLLVLSINGFKELSNCLLFLENIRASFTATRDAPRNALFVAFGVDRILDAGLPFRIFSTNTRLLRSSVRRSKLNVGHSLYAGTHSDSVKV